ncbi:MAG: S8 family serine peptidase [Candidatus Caldarchaeum sp.]
MTVLTLLFFATQNFSLAVSPQHLEVRAYPGRYELLLPNQTPFYITRSPVRKARALHFTTGTVIALWEERSNSRRWTPYYGISLDGANFARITKTDYTLLLRYAPFDPLIEIPAVPVPLEAGTDNEIYIVQFHSQPLDEYRNAIRTLGGMIYHYLANHAYLVRMDRETKERVRALPFVRWIGNYEPAYRLDPILREELLRGFEGKKRVIIQVFEKGLGQKVILGDKIRAMGGEIINQFPTSYFMEAVLSRDQLLRVIKENEVFYVDPWTPAEPDVNIAREIGGANYVGTVGNYRGEGVRGEMMDTNLRLTHVDFQNPAPIWHGPSSTLSASHGTNTTGIVFGQGRGNATATGFLPLGQCIFATYQPISGGTRDRYAHTQELLGPPYYAVFQSNSWGNTQVTNYTTISAQMDDIIFDLDILICQSQSNTGDQRSRPQAWAKNIVAVGGVYHRDTLTKTDDSWSNGASVGPAEDGRVKPDLTHFYDMVLTTSSSSDTAYTTSFGGTSAATPITAGHFGLFFQMWADGVFGNSVMGATVFDARPHFSTAKAMLINTAVPYDWTAGGTNADLTRFRQGWGMVDIKQLYDRRNNLFIVNEEDVLQNLETKTYRLYVPPGQVDLRVTLHYPDPPGTTSSTQHRINDVTLKVTSPIGTVYWGNNGLVSGIWSQPGGSPDTKNTVENVFIQNPTPGVWIIEVQANEVNQDGHVETPGLDVDYALVVSGVVSGLAPSSFQVVRGQVLSGGLTELGTSNNQYLRLRPWIIPNTQVPPVEVLFEATSPTTSLTELKFRIEGNVNTAGIQQTIELYNFSTNSWVTADIRALPTSDNVVEIIAPGSASQFVQSGTGTLRARVSWKPLNLTLIYPWVVSVDQVRWTITP